MTTQPTDALLKALFEESAQIPLGFEMFPPKTPLGRADLLDAATRLAAIGPQSFSVTMGAGGTARRGTHETALDIKQATSVPVTAHLTALGLDRETIAATAEGFWQDGITRILALRGDAPKDADPAEIPHSYDHASGLVRALREMHDFEIAVAAYPEKHPEAASLDSDIEHLKQKLDAGASEAICQFVLNPEAYGRFLDACAAHGVTAPIVPGVMPLDNWPRIRRFAVSTGASVPPWLDRLFEGTGSSRELMHLTAMAATLEQVRRLVAYGAPALHVYTLNRWEIPLAIARMLGRTIGSATPEA